ncbi:MAG: DUF3369 domain-containing protein [Pseudomonadales bacterium]
MYDFLLSDDDKDPKALDSAQDVWNILIVDDEPAVHSVTCFALEDESFEGKRFNFISAYNAAQARDILTERQDIALVILDVVMETDSAGLEVAQWIRQELGNKLIRIVLRTGQPGQAPEKDVILNYDIYDYKNKTELTAQKLFSCVISGLRSYRDVLALSNHSTGIKKVISASAGLFKKRYVKEFSGGVLQQISSLLYIDADAVLVSATSGCQEVEDVSIVAAIGAFEHQVGESAAAVLSADVLNKWLEGEKILTCDREQNKILLSCNSDDKHKMLLCLKYKRVLVADDLDLLELFIQNVSIAEERMRFWQDTEDTLNEIIELLSTSSASHHGSGNQHFTGVTKVAMLLARKHGLVLKKNLDE